MPSIFHDQFVAESFLKYWKTKPLIVNFEGQTSILGIQEKTIWRNLKFQRLFSLYDSFLKVREGCEVSDILFFLDNLAKQQNINEISIKIGYSSETLLNPELSLKLLAENSKLPHNFILKKIDEEAVVDLSIALPSYLKSIRSGFSRHYERGCKKNLYDVDIKGKNLSRVDFDLCLKRIHQSYIDRGRGFKWTEQFQDDVFSFFMQGKAILFSAKAKSSTDVYADLLILHDGIDAFRFGASRREGQGVLNGISHFLQIFCLDYLAKSGFRYYDLGCVGQGDNFIDVGVRFFKRHFATNIVSVLHFYRADFLTKAINFAKKIKSKI